MKIIIENLHGNTAQKLMVILTTWAKSCGGGSAGTHLLMRSQNLLKLKHQIIIINSSSADGKAAKLRQRHSTAHPGFEPQHFLPVIRRFFQPQTPANKSNPETNFSSTLNVGNLYFLYAPGYQITIQPSAAFNLWEIWKSGLNAGANNARTPPKEMPFHPSFMIASQLIINILLYFHYCRSWTEPEWKIVQTSTIANIPVTSEEKLHWVCSVVGDEFRGFPLALLIARILRLLIWQDVTVIIKPSHK